MTKLSIEDKQQIISLIEQTKVNLGTYDAVARKCSVSPAVITQLRKNQYQAEGDDMWLEVGIKLDWKPQLLNSNNWVFVKDFDYKVIRNAVINAKEKSLFSSISDVAGIGKTASLKNVAAELAENNVYYLRCWDWGKREFMINLCKCLGIDTSRGVKTPNDYLQLVIEFFQNKVMQKPVLIIDEADKLKAAALRFLIAIFNDCEDILACLISGTENLEKEIKKGVRLQAKGYDEIDSRFGRTFIKLRGCTESEVKEICFANGVKDAAVVKGIFEQCLPVRKFIKVGGKEQNLRVITDKRRLKRLVQKEQLKTITNN